MKQWKGIEGVMRVPAARDVSDTEARASGLEMAQRPGRPTRSLMGRTLGRPCGAVGSIWPLDSLVGIRHVKG